MSWSTSRRSRLRSTPIPTSTRGRALAFARDPEQHVTGGDLAVPEPQRLAQRELEDLLRPGSQRRPARCAPRCVRHFRHLLAYHLERKPERVERSRGCALAYLKKPQQKVLGAHEAMVELARLLLGKLDRLLSSRVEAFEHPTSLPPRRPTPRSVSTHRRPPTNATDRRSGDSRLSLYVALHVAS